MPLYNKTAATSAARGTSLTYITIGALLAIWSAVWFFGFSPESRPAIVICAGLFLTGLTFLGIGLGLGQISKAAREDDTPPETVTVTNGATPTAQNTST